MDIFDYNTQIYREMLLQFPQFTEKYYVNRKPFYFRRRAEAVLRRSARLVLARLKNDFIRRSEPCYMKKFWHASAQHGV